MCKKVLVCYINRPQEFGLKGDMVVAGQRTAFFKERGYSVETLEMNFGTAFILSNIYFYIIACIRHKAIMPVSLLLIEAKKDINLQDYDTIYCITSRSTFGIVLTGQNKNRLDNVVVDFVDPLWLSLRNRSQNARGLKKFIYWLESRFTKNYELSILPKNISKLVCLNRSDKPSLPKNTVVCGIVPNNVQPRSMKTLPVNGQITFGFWGNLDYIPNERAVYKIFKIAQKLPNHKFKIGGFSNKFTEQIDKPSNIHLEIPFKNIDEFLHNVDVAFFPITDANGIQNKILEAINYNIPIFCSPHLYKTHELRNYSFAHILPDYIENDLIFLDVVKDLSTRKVTVNADFLSYKKQYFDVTKNTQDLNWLIEAK